MPFAALLPHLPDELSAVADYVVRYKVDQQYMHPMGSPPLPIEIVLTVEYARPTGGPLAWHAEVILHGAPGDERELFITAARMIWLDVDQGV